MPTVMSRVLIQTSQGTLEIEDTSGDPELDRLRPMGYSEAKMVLVAFAIDSRASFLDVQDKVSALDAFLWDQKSLWI